MKIKVKKIFKGIVTALIALVLVLTVLLVALKFIGETPSVFGYNFYYIITGSMEPTIEVGDIIIGKQTPPSKLKENDIVTFEGQSGELAGKVVTHRIKEIYEEDGSLYLITRGDANTANDPPVSAENVISVMKAKVPLLGKLITIINTPWGFLLLIIAPLMLSLVKEIIELIQTFRPTKEEQGNEESDK